MTNIESDILAEYSKELKDVQNLLLIGKEVHRSWRDICIRYHKGEIAHGIPGKPLLFDVMAYEPQDEEVEGLNERLVQYRLDSHRYSFPLWHYLLRKDERFSKNIFNSIIQANQIPLVIFAIDVMGVRTRYDLVRDYLVMKQYDLPTIQKCCLRSIEIVKDFRRVTNVPVILTANTDQLPTDVFDWADKVVLCQKLRLTSRRDLYRI